MVDLSGGIAVSYFVEFGDAALKFFSGEPYTIDRVDTVVLVMGREPNTQLAEALQGRIPKLYEIGDCYSPRKVNHAIYDGFTAGVKI